MPSLRDCLKKLGKRLSQAEAKAMHERSAQYQKDGYSVADAERMAVEATHQEANGVRNSIYEQARVKLPVDEVKPVETKPADAAPEALAEPVAEGLAGRRDPEISRGDGVPTAAEKVMLKEQQRLIDENAAKPVDAIPQSEVGAISPRVLAPVGGGAVGAAYGLTQGDTAEERIANAMLYGSMGLAAGAATSHASLAKSLFKKPFRKYPTPSTDKYVKMLTAKPKEVGMMEFIKDKFGKFRFALNTKWAPIGEAQRSLFKAAGEEFIPNRGYDLERRFERIAGAPMRGELKVGKLLEVVESLPKAEAQDLDVYLVMHRVADRLRTQVVENNRLYDAVGRAEAELELAVAANKAKSGLRNSRAVLTKRATLKKANADLKKNIDRKRVGKITLEQSEKDIAEFRGGIGEERYNRLAVAGEKYQNVMRTILDEQVASGRMGRNLVERIHNSSDFYAPFKLLKYFEDGEGFVKGGGTRRIPSSEKLAKKITGIDDEDFRLESPLATSAEQLYKGSLLAEKNVALRHLASLSRVDPDGTYLRIVGEDATPRQGYEIVNYFQNGKIKRLEVNKAIGAALSGMNSAETGMILNGLSRFSQVFKLGATGLSIPFNIANAGVFDPLRLATISRYGFRSPADLIYTMFEWPRALGASMRGNFGQALGTKPGDLYSRYMDSGAAGGTLARVLSPESFKGRLPKDWKLTDQVDRGFQILKTPLKVAALFTNTLEETTKLWGFKRALRIEKFDKLTPAEQARKMPEIANEIRNYAGSPDFSRSGVLMKPLNIILPFMNPRWQGTIADFARMNPFRHGNAKDAGAAWLRLGTMVAVPTAAYAYYNLKDPVNRKDFLDIPQKERDRYFHIPMYEGPRYEGQDRKPTILNTGDPYYFTNKDGQQVRGYYRIPKRELPALVANTIEDMALFALSEGEESLTEFGKNFAENTAAWALPVNIEGDTLPERFKSAASGLNPVIKIPAEIAVNENLWTGRPIVPESMIDAPGSEQYTSKTPEAFKRIAEVLPEGLGKTLTSPLNIQHAVEGFTGGVTRQFGGSELSEGNPASDWPPFLRRFFRSEFKDTGKLPERVDAALQAQASERLQSQRMAEQIFDIVQKQPSEKGRQKILRDATSQGLMTKDVVRYLKQDIKDDRLGLTYKDRRVKRNIQIKNGHRARYYLLVIEDMTEEETAIYLQDQWNKKLATDEVLAQMQAIRAQ